MINKFTVTQLNKYIKNNFEIDYVLNNVLVDGEISNLKNSYNNYYFSLKDDNSSLNCIVFDSIKNIDKQILYNGSKVQIKGKVSVYEKNGTYSLYVYEIEKLGIGDFYKQLEQLKNELKEKGMFSEIYKKPIPKFSNKIGIVTSKNGAAIKDITKNIYQINPYAELFLYPAKVQGENSSKSIIKGIVELDKLNLDVIIIGRGGGSNDDLYSFNDEQLAYAIFNAKTPIISAVGHEIDLTIADLVADIRVSTPTEAAIKSTYNYFDLIDSLIEYKNEFIELLSEKIEILFEKHNNYLEKISYFSPITKLNNNYDRYNQIKYELKNLLNNKYIAIKSDFDVYINQLELLNPINKLKSGMVYALNKNKKNINSIKDVLINENIDLLLKDGVIKAKTVSINKEKYINEKQYK